MVSLNPATTPTAFRADIQGLRALAASLVVLFHINPAHVSGGYVGVDVFFVISGFLITRILVRDASRGTLSFGEFYRRRAFRLLPVACVVLAATALAAFVLYPSSQWSNLGREILASTFYVENFYLHVQGLDYLASDHIASPVQHYWSLSIEEQFYLVWPAVVAATIWAARRASRPHTPVLLGVFAVTVAASLAASIQMRDVDGSGYFLTHVRIWELALGGMIGVMASPVSLPEVARGLLRWAGLAAIFVSGFLFDAQTAFPGYAALVPTLGVGTLLWVEKSSLGWDPSALLESRAAQWLGDLSYSIYLWHWPVIILSAVAFGVDPAAPVWAVVLISVTLVLSWVSKTHVEDRFRHGLGRKRASEKLQPATRSRPGLRTLKMPSAFMAGSTAAGLALMVPALAATRTGPAPDALTQAHPGALALWKGVPAAPDTDFVPSLTIALTDNPSVYADGCHVARPDTALTPCLYGDPASPRSVMIVGDSHAAQWVPALQVLADTHAFRLLTNTKSSCAFSGRAAPRLHADYPECAAWNANLLDAILADPPDELVVARIADRSAADREPDEERVAALRQTLEDITRKGTRVTLLAPTPRFDGAIPDCVALNGTSSDQCGGARNEVLFPSKLHIAAADGLAGVELADLNDSICGPVMCEPVVGNVLVYRDAHHLTATYARSLAQPLGEVLGLTARESAAPVEMQLDRKLLANVSEDFPGAAADASVGAGVGADPGGAQAWRPGLDDLRRDFASVFQQGCHVGKSETEPRTCELGDPAGRVTIAVVGDGHAAHWTPAFDAYGRARNIRILSVTKSGCPLVGLTLLNASDPYAECDVWNASVRERLLSDSPDLVVAALSPMTNAAAPEPGETGKTALVRGLADAYAPLLEAGIDVAMIRQTPRLPFDVHDCLAEKDPQSCSAPRDVALRRFDPTPQVAARFPEISLLDMTDRLCGPSTCPSVRGRVAIYRDSHSLSKTYVETMVPYLAVAVDSIIGSGREPGAN